MSGQLKQSDIDKITTPGMHLCDRATMHGVAFRGAPIIIEQPRPFSVDELAKAAQLHG